MGGALMFVNDSEMGGGGRLSILWAICWAIHWASIQRELN